MLFDFNAFLFDFPKYRRYSKNNSIFEHVIDLYLIEQIYQWV